MTNESFIINNLSHSDLTAQQFFCRLVVEQRLFFNYKQYWTTPEIKGEFVAMVKQLGTLLHYDMSFNNTLKEVILNFETLNVYVHLYYEQPIGYFQVHIASRGELADKQLKKLLDSIKECFPIAIPTEVNQVSISFSSVGTGHGARITNRDILVQPWADIVDNYNNKVQQQLDHILKTFQPGKGGQLLLWHGDPGTGKTFALRALCHAWKSWCDSYYVLDPEVFFGDAGYMLDLIMHEPYNPLTDDLKGPDTPKTKWKLLILEDAGELLTADARERTGQGLARLLNTVDGLIGQGLKLLVLITTNESLHEIHPAVARPGRCASEIYFKPFDPEEAKKWMEAHDLLDELEKIDTTPDKRYSLAEMFSIKEGFVGAKGQPVEKKKFGFIQ